MIKGQLEIIKDVPVIAELVQVSTMVWKGLRISLVDPIRAALPGAEIDKPSIQRFLYLLVIVFAHLSIAIGVAVQIAMDTTKGNDETETLYNVTETDTTVLYSVSRNQIWELGVFSTLFALAGLANLGFRFTDLGIHEQSRLSVAPSIQKKATFLTTVVRYVQLLSLLDVFLVCSNIGWIIGSLAEDGAPAKKGDYKL
jgi:hypothetical protein